MMKNFIIFLLIVLPIHCISQADGLQNERYEVINALFKNDDTLTFGKVKLSKNFFQFRGLVSVISNSEFIDNLMGHCIDIEKKEVYSFKDVITYDEIRELTLQVRLFSQYRYLNQEHLADNIEVIEDLKNRYRAITLPLIINNKAILYLNNKENEEILIVMVKQNNEWIVRCRKEFYLRFDD